MAQSCGTPHDVGAYGVVLGLGQGLGAFFNQGLQNAFGKPVLQRRIGGVGEVLLHHMGKSVHHPVAHLAHWQRQSGGRVEHRELRVAVVAGEGHLGLQRLAGDHRAVVHFRAGGWQREHRTKRQRLRDVAAAFLQDGPGVALEQRSRRDKLGAVDDRAATHGQQKVNLLAAHQLHGLHQGLVARVGLDTLELQKRAPGQRGMDLVQHAIAADAAAAKQHQHPRIGRDVGTQVGDAALAEQDVGGVVEVEVVHGGALGVLSIRAKGDDRTRPHAPPVRHATAARRTGLSQRAGNSRTTKAPKAATTAKPVTALQPHCASARLPSAAPAAIPMNMPTNRIALSRLRAPGSMP